MKIFCIILFCAFLKSSFQNPTNQWTIQPNIQVVEVGGEQGSLNIYCQQLITGGMIQTVQWKKNDVIEPQKGNTYSIQLEESLGGGNYTCHSAGGSLLNYSTVLLLRRDENKRILKPLQGSKDCFQCDAENYSGGFRCSWEWFEREGHVVYVSAQRYDKYSDDLCRLDPSNNLWSCEKSGISCAVDSTGLQISCMDEQHCPYSEESKHIKITLFLRSKNYLVEIYTKEFRLSDIVKPGKVNLRKINSTMMGWTYPGSWNTPHDYFPLTFQVAQYKKRCKGCKNPCDDLLAKTSVSLHTSESCYFHVKENIKTFCVRGKDDFSDSEWGPWRYIMKRRGGRKKKRMENGTKLNMAGPPCMLPGSSDIIC